MSISDNEKNQIITLAKLDLSLTTTAYDDLINHYFDAAWKKLELEGIDIAESNDDWINCKAILIHYIAYLFRQRANNDTGMSPMLRQEINNLLFYQKSKYELSTN